MFDIKGIPHDEMIFFPKNRSRQRKASQAASNPIPSIFQVIYEETPPLLIYIYTKEHP